ncbi:homoserine dehydrogenase [Aquisalibacillus elongatus]|uniref:Homoserine dehydrogenase n=1 Tax=Aquisalibacillus elongatus TaxID=485577 RepID=A0A3N5C9R6_9BACI|nr:homoserine dehydrogenase [Aquisalibacillus elongatus]RPF53421.1 homoserine dehydrogenase [Aquisalibacillus elongatus]
MDSVKVAILGFGTVGSGIYEIISEQQERLEKVLGRPVEVAAVLVKDCSKERTIPSDVLVTDDFDDILRLSDLDAVFEAIVGVEPGYTYLSKAIDAGLHVVTANKELFAYRGLELKQRAEERGVNVRFEATVAGGVPIIGALCNLLRMNQIVKIEAILNGTSNYILTKMREEQVSFDQALSEAQRLGYAEADPTNDIEGFDALFKVVILAELLSGQKVDWDEVYRKGISHITAYDLAQANGRIKHIGRLVIDGDGIHADVRPISLTESHKLYPIEGVDNAIVVTGDLVGELVFQGPGAGKLPTASVMVEDFVDLFKSARKPVDIF